jgi:hypothetical protein
MFRIIKIKQGEYRKPFPKNIKPIFKWFYSIIDVFTLSAEICTERILFNLCVLNNTLFYLNINLSSVTIPLPDKIDNIISHTFNIFIGKHKDLEIESYTTSSPGFSILFRYVIHEDHPGLMIEIKFIMFVITFHFYDGRHWNYDSGDWEKYNIVEETK